MTLVADTAAIQLTTRCHRPSGEGRGVRAFGFLAGADFYREPGAGQRWRHPCGSLLAAGCTQFFWVLWCRVGLASSAHPTKLHEPPENLATPHPQGNRKRGMIQGDNRDIIDLEVGRFSRPPHQNLVPLRSRHLENPTGILEERCCPIRQSSPGAAFRLHVD